MEARKLNRGLIEIAVSQGIRDIRQNPKRGLRRLADLGEHFASGRFSQNVFLEIHQALDQEESPYYRLIQNLVNSTEEDTIKNFCLNLGYNSWIYGAGKLSRVYKEKKEVMSWLCRVNYDGEKRDPADTIRKISHIIRQKRDKGAFAYSLFPGQTFSGYPEPVFLLDRYSDCAFAWFFKESTLTGAQLRILKKHNNCIYLFPAKTADGTPNVSIGEAARKEKLLYSYYYLYEEEDGSLEDILNTLQLVLDQEPLFLVLKAGETVTDVQRKACARDIWSRRMEPQSDTFLIEYTEDARAVQDMITGKKRKMI